MMVVDSESNDDCSSTTSTSSSSSSCTHESLIEEVFQKVHFLKQLNSEKEHNNARLHHGDSFSTSESFLQEEIRKFHLKTNPQNNNDPGRDETETNDNSTKSCSWSEDSCSNITTELPLSFRYPLTIRVDDDIDDDDDDDDDDEEKHRPISCLSISNESYIMSLARQKQSRQHNLLEEAHELALQRCPPSSESFQRVKKQVQQELYEQYQEHYELQDERLDDALQEELMRRQQQEQDQAETAVATDPSEEETQHKQQKHQTLVVAETVESSDDEYESDEKEEQSNSCSSMEDEVSDDEQGCSQGQEEENENSHTNVEHIGSDNISSNALSSIKREAQSRTSPILEGSDHSSEPLWGASSSCSASEPPARPTLCRNDISFVAAQRDRSRMSKTNRELTLESIDSWTNGLSETIDLQLDTPECVSNEGVQDEPTTSPQCSRSRCDDTNDDDIGSSDTDSDSIDEKDEGAPPSEYSLDDQSSTGSWDEQELEEALNDNDNESLSASFDDEQEMVEWGFLSTIFEASASFLVDMEDDGEKGDVDKTSSPSVVPASPKTAKKDLTPNLPIRNVSHRMGKLGGIDQDKRSYPDKELPPVDEVETKHSATSTKKKSSIPRKKSQPKKTKTKQVKKTKKKAAAAEEEEATTKKEEKKKKKKKTEKRLTEESTLNKPTELGENEDKEQKPARTKDTADRPVFAWIKSPLKKKKKLTVEDKESKSEARADDSKEKTKGKYAMKSSPLKKKKTAPKKKVKDDTDSKSSPSPPMTKNTVKSTNTSKLPERTKTKATKVIARKEEAHGSLEQVLQTHSAIVRDYQKRFPDMIITTHFRPGDQSPSITLALNRANETNHAGGRGPLRKTMSAPALQKRPSVATKQKEQANETFSAGTKSPIKRRFLKRCVSEPVSPKTPTANHKTPPTPTKRRSSTWATPTTPKARLNRQSSMLSPKTPIAKRRQSSIHAHPVTPLGTPKRRVSMPAHSWHGSTSPRTRTPIQNGSATTTPRSVTPMRQSSMPANGFRFLSPSAAGTRRPSTQSGFTTPRASHTIRSAASPSPGAKKARLPPPPVNGIPRFRRRRSAPAKTL